jgi:hypothetical protein
MPGTDSICLTSVEGTRAHLRVRILFLLVVTLLLGSASALRAATVTAAWNANPESNIAGYQLSYGTQTGVYTTTVDVGNVTSRILTLTNGQRYYFAVKAYNISATSAYSAEVFFDVPASTAVTISSLSSTSGWVGRSVTIAGTNFGASQGASTVTFNGTQAAAAAPWTATSLGVVVPANATTGNVVVTVGGVASNGVMFTVAPMPTVTGLSPPSGPITTSVTISGANFGATKGLSTTTFNGTDATPTMWSASSIIVPVPTNATTGNVVVTVGGGASNGVSFTVVPTPNITNLSPSNGPVGTSVTIAGSNFGTAIGTSTVRFNGTPATPTTWSATSLVVPVPAGATTGSVVVTVGGVASNGASFTVGPATASPITLTQHAGLAAGGASAALTFPSPNVAGNFIAVATRAFFPNQTFTVTDTRGNFYRRALTVNNGADDTLALFYAENVAAGANTVTVALSTSASLRLAIFEYSGIAPTNALDVIATAAGSSASPSSGSATTTTPGDLLIGVVSTESFRTFTAGSGYTVRRLVAAAPSTVLMVEDRIQATAGAVSATATLNTSDLWGAGLAAFKKAATGTNLAPTLTQPANQTSAENATVLLQLAASDPDGTALTYSATGLPPVLGLNTATGAITGTLTFTSAGTYPVTATVSDGALTNSKNFTWTVTNVNRAPTLTQPANQTSAGNATVSLQLAASDPDGTALTYSATGLPPSLTVNATTGVIAGTLSSTGATYTVAATVSDGSLANSKTFTWTVSNVNRAPILTQPANQTSAENATISLQLVASDPDGTAPTYSATGLPASLSVNATTGLITGILSFTSAGTHTVTATASDGSLTNNKTFTWTVSNVNRAPTLTQPANQSSAENAVISLPLAASDPDGTALTYSATSLPASLSVNATTGVISGTLTSTSAGTYSVVATASDGSLTNSKTFTWNVTDVAQTPNITGLSPATGPIGTSVTISGSNFGATMSSVTFNGTPAMPTTWAATSIAVPVPAGATTGNVVVTVGGTASNGVGFTVGPATPSPITLTQKASLASGGTSATLTFPASNVAGNFIVVVTRAFFPNQTFTVTDTRGNTYRRAFTLNNNADDTVALFYAENVAAGPNTVTVALSTSASLRLAVLEYAGVARTNALDVTATVAGSSASPSSGSAITTASGDLLIGVVSTESYRTITPGSGYTLRAAVSAAPSTVLMVEDRIQATAGAASATATLNTSDLWGAGLAAFKAAPSAAPAALTSVRLSAMSDFAAFTVSQRADAPRDDYDGDGKADVTVFTASTGTWSILESSTGTARTATLGAAGDRSVPGDYEGDGKTDIAVYSPATGEWSVLLSSSGALRSVAWGAATDLPVPADYDGDGKTDMAVYRPTTGEWIVLQSVTHTTRTVIWGSSADVPVPGDYDGDGRVDVAVYRPTTGLWQVLQSGTNTTATATWGSPGAVAMPGDYDGDGRIDVAVYRASTGLWSILQSSTATVRRVSWGDSRDVPIPGDYDGDGTTDPAVYRPSTGLWQVLPSIASTTWQSPGGMKADIPVR